MYPEVLMTLWGNKSPQSKTTHIQLIAGHLHYKLIKDVYKCNKWELETITNYHKSGYHNAPKNFLNEFCRQRHKTSKHIIEMSRAHVWKCTMLKMFWTLNILIQQLYIYTRYKYNVHIFMIMFSRHYHVITLHVILVPYSIILYDSIICLLLQFI